jgi:hypothetical protein
MKLNKRNINEFINKYLKSVNSMKPSETQYDVLRYLCSLKKDKVKFGLYKNVSIFEASNRIFSDMIMLLGVRMLLDNSKIEDVTLPFKEY